MRFFKIIDCPYNRRHFASLIDHVFWVAADRRFTSLARTVQV